jgi:hypothetical protein
MDEPAGCGGLWLPDQVMAPGVFSDPNGQSQTFMPRIRPVVSVDTEIFGKATDPFRDRDPVEAGACRGMRNFVPLPLWLISTVTYTLSGLRTEA